MNSNEIDKFFIAHFDDSKESEQRIIAWKNNDDIGTLIDPTKLIGKKIIGFKYIQTNTGKTLFLLVE